MLQDRSEDPCRTPLFYSATKPVKGPLLNTLVLQSHKPSQWIHAKYPCFTVLVELSENLFQRSLFYSATSLVNGSLPNTPILQCYKTGQKTLAKHPCLTVLQNWSENPCRTGLFYWCTEVPLDGAVLNTSLSPSTVPQWPAASIH